MLYTIEHRVSGAVLFSLGCGSFKLCVEAAVKSGAYLRVYAWRDEKGVIVYRAGCHEWFSIDDALTWYGASYPSDGDRTECIARLNLLHSETLRRWPAISNGSAEA